MFGLAILSSIIAVTSVRDSYPALSPDGSALLFHSNRTGRQAIWVAAADGSRPRILFDDPALGTDPGTPVWSPDGRRIAFAMRPAAAKDENESEIYLMKADGRDVRRLTNAPGDDSHPHWTADGKRIYFNSARATPDLKADWSRQWIDIYSMEADGTDVRRLTDCRSICTYPVPSPDGRLLAYRRVMPTLGLSWELEPTARNSEVFVSRSDGSEARNVSNSSAYDGWPMWSPDSAYLVFASNRDRVRSTGQIFRVRPDGTDIERLTQGPFSHVQPSFTADGKAILAYRLTEEEGTEIGQLVRIDLGDSQ